MTLKEKFKQWLNTNPRLEIREVQLEQIADDYAIEFAMHISTHCYCELGNDTRSYKELLEIFKKEKGL